MVRVVAGMHVILPCLMVNPDPAPNPVVVPDWVPNLTQSRVSSTDGKAVGEHVKTAVEYAVNGIRGRELVEATPDSLRARAIIFSPLYENFYVFLILILLVQVQWEYPSLQATLTSQLTCQWLDALCLVAIIVDMCYLQRSYYGPSEWLTKGWVQLKGLVLVAMITNTLVSIAHPATPDVARLLRPLLLIERKSTVRKIFNTIFKALPRILSVATLMLIHVVVFSVAAFILFRGVEGPPACKSLWAVDRNDAAQALVSRCSVWFPAGCRGYFGSIEEALVHIFAMTTGAEFPGAMLPAMACNPWNATFFVLAFVTGNFFVLRLCFAVVYDDSSTFKKEEIILRYARAFQNYDAAFETLTGKGTPPQQLSTTVTAVTAGDAGAGEGSSSSSGSGIGIGGSAILPPPPPATLSSITTILGGQGLLTKERFLQFWRLLRPTMDAQLSTLLYDSIDTQGKGALTKDMFRRLCYLYCTVQGHRSSITFEGDDMQALQLADSEGGMEGRGGGGRMGHGGEGGEKSSLAAALQRSLEAVEAEKRGSSGGGGGSPAGKRMGGKGKGDSSSSSSSSSSNGGAPMESPNPLNAAAAAAAVAADMAVAEASALTIASSASTALPPPSSSSSSSSSSSTSTPSPRHRASFFGDSNLPPSEPKTLKATYAATILSLQAAAQAYYVGNMPNLEEKLVMLVHHGVPTGINPHGWQARGLHVMHNVYVHVFNEACGLLNAICVLCILSLEPYPALRPTAAIFTLIYYVTFALFGLEVILLMLFTGPLRWIQQSAWNAADVFIFAFALTGTVLDQYRSVINTEAVFELVAFALLCRLAKVLRVLRLLPGLERACIAGYAMITPMSRYLIIILCVLWSYALVGTVYFGSGLLGAGNPAIAATAYATLGYFPLNFDTPLQALVVMVHQLNIMEWPVIMEACVAALNSGWARFFFMSFWFVGVFIVLNITIAFVVAGFSAERSRQERRGELEAAVLDELLDKIGKAKGKSLRHGHGGGILSGLVGRKKSMELEARFRPLCAWREELAASGKDFTQWRLVRPQHHLDIYGSIYHEDIENAFPEVFGGRGSKGVWKVLNRDPNDHHGHGHHEDEHGEEGEGHHHHEEEEKEEDHGHHHHHHQGEGGEIRLPGSTHH